MDRRHLLRAVLFGSGGLLLGCADRGPATTTPPAEDPDPGADGGGPTAGDGGPVPAGGGGSAAAGTDGEDGPAGVDQPPQPPVRAPQIEVLCRDALGLAVAGSGARTHLLDRVMLHHSAVRLDADADAPQRLRRHQRHHQQRGWHDIAYHYGIDRAGHVYQLRDPTHVGDTGTAYDPTGALLLVCEGDFDQQAPTDAMLSAVAGLLAHAATAFGLPVEGLVAHRDETVTACPGDRLYARLPELRAEAAALVGDPPPALVEVCGGAGRARVAAIEGR